MSRWEIPLQSGITSVKKMATRMKSSIQKTIYLDVTLKDYATWLTSANKIYANKILLKVELISSDDEVRNFVQFKGPHNKYTISFRNDWITRVPRDVENLRPSLRRVRRAQLAYVSVNRSDDSPPRKPRRPEGKAFTCSLKYATEKTCSKVSHMEIVVKA